MPGLPQCTGALSYAGASSVNGSFNSDPIVQPLAHLSAGEEQCAVTLGMRAFDLPLSKNLST